MLQQLTFANNTADGLHIYVNLIGILPFIPCDPPSILSYIIKVDVTTD